MANSLIADSRDLLIEALGEQAQLLEKHIESFNYPAAMNILQNIKTQVKQQGESSF